MLPHPYSGSYSPYKSGPPNTQKKYEDLQVRFQTIQRNYLNLRKSQKENMQRNATIPEDKVSNMDALNPFNNSGAGGSMTQSMSYRNLGQPTEEHRTPKEPPAGSLISPGARRTKRFGSAGRRRSLPVVPSAKQITGWFKNQTDSKGPSNDNLAISSPRKKAPPRRRYSAGIVRSHIPDGDKQTRSIYSPLRPKPNLGFRPEDFEKSANTIKLHRSNSNPIMKPPNRRPKPSDFDEKGHGRTISLSDIPEAANPAKLMEGMRYSDEEDNEQG